MKKFIAVIAILLCIQTVKAQQDTLVHVMQEDNKVRFKPNLPPLKQIPGAPKPFYTYLWDFGDGHFSRSENPEHVYDKPGDYEAILYAVNNYDDGKKPGRRPVKISVKNVNKAYLASLSPAESNFFKANGVFELKYDCMAKPGDTMVLIAGWKNVMQQNGKLYLLLNEKQFGQNSFDTAGFRFYHEAALAKESLNPAGVRNFDRLLLSASGSPASHFIETKNFSGSDSKLFLANTLKLYNHSLAVDIKNDAAEAQFMFANLLVTPEMIKDTNATITITGLFVPDTGAAYMHLLHIPVVASHDPNKMSLKQSRLNYRLLKKKKRLTYKVRFQNDGKGPARRIKLDITLPTAFDPQTIRIKDLSPYCLPCDSVPEKKGCWELQVNNDSVAFIFNGIYLPGTNQQGVEDKDSTKGFVEFDVQTKKKLDNLPFKGRTAIYFDNNEPVITNFATGRFRKSLSPLLMAGYEMPVGKNSMPSGLSLGLGIARLAPHRPYLQFEAFLKKMESNNTLTVNRNEILFVNGRVYDVSKFDSTTRFSAMRLSVVPLHLRYNFNDFISAGIGVRVDADLQNNTTIVKNYLLPNPAGQEPIPYQFRKEIKQDAFNTFYYLPFIDVGIGRVRWGPALGARYYWGAGKESYGYVYAVWRL